MTQRIDTSVLVSHALHVEAKLLMSDAVLQKIKFFHGFFRSKSAINAEKNR